jgi:hypothetical protein
MDFYKKGGKIKCKEKKSGQMGENPFRMKTNSGKKLT